MPKVSVITPAYNAEQYLDKTIESVLAQTFLDWEMLIVDDCSLDHTYELASSYADKDTRIKVIKAPKNGGVAAARNIALSVADGQYIAFLDSDDIWLPNKLEKQVEFMKSNHYAFSYTDYQCFDSSSGQKGKIVRCPKTMSANDILKNTAIFCVTVMVDKTMTGVFKMPPLTHTEDNCTWYDILSRGFDAYKLPEVLALYRVGNASLTKNKGKSAKLQWSTYRKFYNFSVLKSGYYFFFYALNAIKKQIL